MGFYLRVYTWMRRGTRGHVALLRGQHAWRLRGTDLTRGPYFIFTLYIVYIIYKSSNYRKTNLLTAIYGSHYVLVILRNFFRVGLNFFFYFDYRTQGVMMSIGWKSQ